MEMPRHSCPACATDGHAAARRGGQPTRRVVLNALTVAALGVSSDAVGASGRASTERAPAPSPLRKDDLPIVGGIIDVHHHVVPPAFLASQPSFPDWIHHWRPAHSIESMDRNGIATAISSLNAPGVTTADPAQARSVTRACNDYAAQLGRDHPGRFGMFAAIAPLDIDGALAEIAYALDVLGAQGIGLMTSYGKTYLASERFAPLFQELDRRRAVVFVHPTIPDIGANFDPPLSPVPLEMPYDTARTLMGMILGGTFARYPNIRFIFNHGGGGLPVLHQRLDLNLRATPEARERFANGIMAELRNVWFDTINVINPANFAMLRQLTAIDKLLFGTDFPGHPAEANVEPLLALPVSAGERRAIAYGNARALFPSLVPAGVAA